MIKSTIDFKQISFPNGETRIDLEYTDDLSSPHNFEWEFKSNADIMELLLFADALKRSSKEIGTITIKYFPYSRQDRSDPFNTSFSLKVMTNIINSIGAKRVVIYDPHSDVTPALINNVAIIKQKNILRKYIPSNINHYLISPDAGATKKTNTLFKPNSTIAVVQCTKLRDSQSGLITGTQVHIDNLHNKPCYIVDDICDGGKTFIEIAKELKKLNAGKIVLLVTHGFFTKGLEVFEGLIDEVYTKEGKIK